jgi:hypothetical protein
MKNSWFTETEVFLLHEIVARLDRLARRRVLDARGVSYPEFLVAMAVRELPEPTHGEVGELLDMSKSLVSQRVSALLAKGIVEQLQRSGSLVIKKPARGGHSGKSTAGADEEVESSATIGRRRNMPRPQFAGGLHIDYLVRLT